jgi:hypothetical protein
MPHDQGFTGSHWTPPWGDYLLRIAPSAARAAINSTMINIDVLREKHPASRVPFEEDFDAHVGAPDCLDSMPVYCFKECVAKAAARLSGSASPCGIKAEMLKSWLLRHGDHSGRLREAMAT